MSRDTAARHFAYLKGYHMAPITAFMLVVFLLSAGDHTVTTFTVSASTLQECQLFAVDIKSLVENNTGVADYGFLCATASLKPKGDKP